MCGIGGVLFKSAQHGRKTGEIAYDILESIYRRGPNSTGVALWQENRDKLLYLGINCEDQDYAPRVIELLDELGQLKAVSDGAGFIRAALLYDGDDRALVDAIDQVGPGVTVGHIGSHLEVIKHMGGVANLESNFHLKDYDGPMAIGLTRFATESTIDFTHAQPLSARTFRDMVIMHNGHVTNYHRLRYKYEQDGYTFATGNDSEVLGIALIDDMSKGKSFREALENTVETIDGCFTYIAITDDEVALVKDRYGSKPMVVGETDSYVAMASDSWAVCEGVKEAVSVWEPGAGEVCIWPLGTA